MKVLNKNLITISSFLRLFSIMHITKIFYYSVVGNVPALSIMCLNKTSRSKESKTSAAVFAISISSVILDMHIYIELLFMLLIKSTLVGHENLLEFFFYWHCLSSRKYFTEIFSSMQESGESNLSTRIIKPELVN